MISVYVLSMQLSFYFRNNYYNAIQSKFIFLTQTKFYSTYKINQISLPFQNQDNKHHTYLLKLNKHKQFLVYKAIISIKMIKMFNLSTSKIASFATRKVVLVRGGQNIWSKEKRWTGWIDMRLSSVGIKQSRQCGKLLKDNAFEFDQAYTSILTRSVQSFNKICEELDCFYIPVHKTWKLNQKHYGALQGENKGEMRQKYGQIVEKWRRKLNVRPPRLQQSDPTTPRNDPKYASIDSSLLPLAESMQDVVNRVKPLWQQQISPKVKQGKNILVVAHGNTLRAFSYILANMKQQVLEQFNVPHCIPLVFTFNQKMQPLNYHYLGEQSQIVNKIDIVQRQIKKVQPI